MRTAEEHASVVHGLSLQLATLKDEYRDLQATADAGVVKGLKQAADMVVAGWPIAARLILAAADRAVTTMPTRKTPPKAKRARAGL